MGLYDQALQLNQQGINQALGIRQGMIGRPTAVDRFMAGLQAGQERLSQSKAQQAAMEAQKAAMERQRQQDAIAAEQRSYDISRRPFSEQEAQMGLDYKAAMIKNMLTPKAEKTEQAKAPNIEWGRGGQGYIWDANKGSFVPATDAGGAPLMKYEAPRVGTGNATPQDKSLIPGTAEWKRLQDVEFREKNQKSNIKDIDTVNQMLVNADQLVSQAPGSYPGAGVRMFNKVIGRSTESTRAQSSLESLQAALMMRMPRMEGPQSDLDVQLYREQAGRIADPTVPAEDKKAAIATIRNIINKYKDVTEETPEGPATPKQNYEGEISKSGKYIFKNGKWVAR